MLYNGLEVGPAVEVNDSLLEDMNGLLPDLSDKYRDTPLSMEALERVVASDDDLLVARFAGSVVGTASIGYFETIEGSDAWLSDMVVARRHQGKGFGRGLLDAVYERAQQRGAARIGWTSHWSRDAAHGLYLASGAEKRDTAVFTKKL